MMTEDFLEEILELDAQHEETNYAEHGGDE